MGRHLRAKRSRSHQGKGERMIDEEQATLAHVPADSFVSTVEVSRAMRKPAGWVRNRLKFLERDGLVRQVSRGDGRTPSLWGRTREGVEYDR